MCQKCVKESEPILKNIIQILDGERTGPSIVALARALALTAAVYSTRNRKPFEEVVKHVLQDVEDAFSSLNLEDVKEMVGEGDETPSSEEMKDLHTFNQHPTIN